MTIAVTCQCGGRFAAAPHLAGKTVRCPNCQQALRVPVPPREPLAPIVNPFSESAAPVMAELVPPVATAAPTFHSQDPFGGKATVGGQGVSQPYPQAAQNYAQPETFPQPKAYARPHTAHDAQGYGQSPQKSYLLYYIVGAVLVGFVGSLVVAGIGIYQVIQEAGGMALFEESPFEESQPLPVQSEDYAKARTQFKTTLTSRGGSPQDWDPLVTPSGAAELVYQSGGHVLHAYVDPPPADGQPKPGVVFLHGGFAWGDGDWEMPQPYRDQGFVVMMPVLRGENGQTGDFSLYYDEVDDVLAATSAFAALPYVDETQLYIAGHSAGGTLATLTAMASDRFAALASFSGSMNQAGVGDWDSDLLVYDEAIERETLMRSPEAFAKSFKCAAQLYYGSEEVDVFAAETRRTATTARSSGQNVQDIIVPGDHFSSVEPAIRRSIIFFRQSGLTSGLRRPALPIATPRAAPPEISPPDFSLPEIPEIPAPSAPTQSQIAPGFPTPETPDFSPPEFPRPSNPIPGRPNIPTPRRPSLPRGPMSRHLGVVTFEISDYTGRLPQKMSAQHALIRFPWADLSRIEFDEEARVIRVPVRRGPSMNTGAAKTSLEQAGFKIGATTFKPNDTEDQPPTTTTP